ncbi:MAG TPA: hypothetical protein H9867_04675 [Candidatus Corynebacterium gallistercoris]|uniref:Insertion element protein n=1 Tax=Candidatus Corynebacterium gallistercoris TaxID=2838530 RepID=A0A9D1UQZ4_9CORY|nr:hypothetical protein [Candidatus Corynebacterium gallistercoris]
MSEPDHDSLPSVNSVMGGRAGHSNGRRATVNNCPYCMSESLFPRADTDNAWECRECRRAFSVKFHGHITA